MSLTIPQAAHAAPRTSTRLLHGLVGEASRTRGCRATWSDGASCITSRIG